MLATPFRMSSSSFAYSLHRCSRSPTFFFSSSHSSSSWPPLSLLDCRERRRSRSRAAPPSCSMRKRRSWDFFKRKIHFQRRTNTTHSKNDNDNKGDDATRTTVARPGSLLLCMPLADEPRDDVHLVSITLQNNSAVAKEPVLRQFRPKSSDLQEFKVPSSFTPAGRKIQ